MFISFYFNTEYKNTIFSSKRESKKQILEFIDEEMTAYGGLAISFHGTFVSSESPNKS